MSTRRTRNASELSPSSAPFSCSSRNGKKIVLYLNLDVIGMQGKIFLMWIKESKRNSLIPLLSPRIFYFLEDLKKQ